MTSVNAPTVDQAMLSNTPNTNRALFKTATYSTSGSWIQLTLLSQTVIFKFHPTDTLRFRILLPTGEVPNFGSDNILAPPDEKLQVSASFEIVRSE